MRRSLLGLAAVSLALTALPALAETSPVLGACADVPGATTVTLAGLTTPVTASATPSPSLAAAPLPATSADTARTFQLDLSGEPVGTTATVTGVLTWGQFVNDFDLRMVTNDASGASQEVNPETMQAREETAVGAVGHCAKITISVRNYLAGPDTLSLALSGQVDEPYEE